MSKHPDLVSELKALGRELAAAIQVARQSKEAKIIRRRMGRVVKAGKVEGKARAERAQVVAAAKIRQVRAAVKDLSSRLKKR